MCMRNGDSTLLFWKYRRVSSSSAARGLIHQDTEYIVLPALASYIVTTMHASYTYTAGRW